MSRNTRITGAIVIAVVVLGGALYLLAPRTTSDPSTANVPSRAASAKPSASADATATPTATAVPGPTDPPVPPKDPLPDPSGAPVPGDLLGRTYGVNPPETLDGRQLVLTLRGADDPHCMALYGGRSTCFTVLWSPVKPGDPGARGSARVADDKLILGFDVVPFDEGCEGTSATYTYKGDAGHTLNGIDTPACTFPGFRQLGITVAGPSPWVFDTRTISRDFALKMKVTVPGGWMPMHDIVGALGLIHTGYPEGPDSTWWGPDILLVEDSQIHDAADVLTGTAKVDRSQFVPWPADFFAYITALPGVAVVSGPEPITIGGVLGTQIRVTTPPMRPLVWMKGDFTALGGGEPSATRRFVVVKTGGHTLFISFFETDPAKFAARDAELGAILASITFE